MTKEEIIQGLYRGNSRAIKEAIKELEKETVSKEVYDDEYFAREYAEYKLWELQQNVCEDSVSRQAVIDNIDSISEHHGGILDIRQVVTQLPSVTPTHGICKDCSHYDPLTCNSGTCLNPNMQWSNEVSATHYCTDFEKRGNKND